MRDEQEESDSYNRFLRTLGLGDAPPDEQVVGSNSPKGRSTDANHIIGGVDDDKVQAADTEKQSRRRSSRKRSIIRMISDAIDGFDNDKTPVEDEDLDEIPQDSFSMLYMAETWQEGWPPILVFGLQIVILSLIIINLLNATESVLDIQWNAPVDLPIEVTAAQYIACVVSVITAGDFVDGVCFAWKRLLPEGYSPSVEGQRPPHSWKWELSNLLRLIEGMFVVLTSFTFIVQSTTVIDIFLNFAGVTFVGELDDAYYTLAEKGLLGRRMRGLTEKVAACKIEIRLSEEKLSRKTYRFLTFVGVVIGMVVGLSSFSKEQDTLHYACKSVKIEVEESVFPGFRRFRKLSGTYRLHNKKINQRPVYVQDQGRGAHVAYCASSNRWIVAPYNTSADGTRIWEPCGAKGLMSRRTRTFDVTELEVLKYYSGDEVDGYIKCNQCSLKRSEETCGFEGECQLVDFKVGELTYEKRQCSCHDRRFGSSCLLKGPCTELRFEGDEFPGYDLSFHLLYYEDEPLLVHRRPAFIQRNFTAAGGFSLMLYDGGRWVVIPPRSLPKARTNFSTIEEYLATEFNALTDSKHYDFEFISETTHASAPSNILFQASLSSVDSLGRMGDEEFRLRCADCHVQECMNHKGFGVPYNADDTLCRNDISDLHGPVYRCHCEPGFIGPLCRTRPAEGKLTLYLDHGLAHSCSTCGDKDEFAVWRLYGFGEGTCIPYPQEPLVFGANGTLIWRQLGLNLNETHFSIFVSDSRKFYPIYNNTGASEHLCTAREGSKEIFAIDRGKEPEDQTTLDFAISLNNDGSFGEVVDPEEVECQTMIGINANECDGSMEYGTLSSNYGYDVGQGASLGDSGKSDLTSAWVQFELDITV